MTDSADGVFEEVEERIEELTGAREEIQVASIRRGWFRLEHAILLALVLMFTAYAVAYFIFDVNLESLRKLGYIGIFLIAMAGAATIVLPTPSTVAIFSGGVLLDPIFGIPAPLLVAIVAALGEAIGEFSGYGLGFASTDLVKQRRVYRKFEGWMRKRGMLTIFLLCTFPNPFFDIAGAAAGATRMAPRRFFIATLGGKFVKDLFLAFGGSFSIGLIAGWL
jgi:uncharacterized membrane protein YdjX (TVP38/TMEM64 family)